MDGGAWRATVRGVAKSWTRLHFHGDVFELSRRGWVVFNVLYLGSQDNCDLLTRFLYRGNKYIFKEVLGALRSTQLSPQWVSPQGFQKAPMFYSKNWEIGPNSATCTWPCWFVARSPHQHHMYDQGCSGFDWGHIFLPWVPSSPFLLAPDYLLRSSWFYNLKLPRWESEWSWIWETKKMLEDFSVKFSFGLKIWNSFSPLTHPQLPWEGKHMDTQCQEPLPEHSYFYTIC